MGDFWLLAQDLARKVLHLVAPGVEKWRRLDLEVQERQPLETGFDLSGCESQAGFTAVCVPSCIV